MTSPNPAVQQAPNGLLSSGTPASTVDDCRDDMLNTFESRTSGLSDNTNYYNSQRRPDAIGIAVPQEMRKLLANVGYPRVYVDSLAERLEIEGFRLGTATAPDDTSGDLLWDWWQANDLDVESVIGFNDALVHGRSYITVAAPDPAVDFNVDVTVPIIRVEPPTSLYAQIDTRTRAVTQAIRAIYDDDGSQVVAATLYLPMQTVVWIKQQGDWAVLQQVPHNLGVVPVVPITHRTSSSDLYGTSRITPELRSVTDAAARILMDMQGAAELMAIPQRLLFGVKPSDIGVDPDTGKSQYDAYMARILAFPNDQGKAVQFSAADLRNFTEALDHLDRKAAQITGLPPQYLGITSQNPPSAEAIKASEARLTKSAERLAKIFGGAWEQAMRIAYAVMNGGIQGIPPQFYRMESVWRDPSTPTYAAKADAASKLYANGQGVIPQRRAWVDMGYSQVEIEENEQWVKQDQATLTALGVFGNTGNPDSPNGGSSGSSPPGSDNTSAAKPTETKTQSQLT